MKRKLDLSMAVKDFKKYYFTVAELKIFCKEQKIPLSSCDRKFDILNKIETFLEIGRLTPSTKTSKQAALFNKKPRVLNDEQKIGEGFKFTREARVFFEETLDKKFKCSVPFLAWVKVNSDKKIKDLKEKYLSLKLLKGKKTINKQFEYNKFTRDFFLANPSLSREDCLNCWRKVRELKDRKYSDQYLNFIF
ncbi:hypothetical protein AB751O23_AX_00050 [Chlamydiales bacterium SCGC AB-751-O23]|nr:hypothetical protein AB751O23_AX_00050 [Chlamydiales bacterium SCGC AB-751-O23]